MTRSKHSYLTKSGKELQSIVRNAASKNIDILRKYDEGSDKYGM